MSWDDWVSEGSRSSRRSTRPTSRGSASSSTTLLDAGARIFQFDAGDGHFIEPITIRPVVAKSISPLIHEAGGVLDCHLMVESPEKHFRAFAEAGGDSVTVHYEVCDDLPGVIGQARGLGLGAGVAFNPETEPEDVAAAAGELVDLVLCMSIHPGYSGQPFMPEAIPRVRRLRELLPEGVHVQVDGGVGPDNVRELVDAGANLLVAGHERVRPGRHRRRVRAPRRSLMLERALELAERGRGRRTRTRSSAPSSSGTGRSSARAGTSGREGHTPRSLRSVRRVRRPAGPRSTCPSSPATTTGPSRRASTRSSRPGSREWSSVRRIRSATGSPAPGGGRRRRAGRHLGGACPERGLADLGAGRPAVRDLQGGGHPRWADDAAR